MRGSALLLVVAAILFGLMPAVESEMIESAVADHGSSAQTKVDFATQIQPILQSRCMPCHFAGGTMYERLPFDQAKTIGTLGEKLFTRIKDENEQRLIREFLGQL